MQRAHNGAGVIALGYGYPTPDSLPVLSNAIESSTDGAVKRHLSHFVDEVSRLPLGAWEELHTTTLDLSPLFVPYVGHVVWGENYRRGEFMADLNREMKLASVQLEGELPDHIAPILRYLSVTDEPLPDLTEVLSEAVSSMVNSLAKAAGDNPYRHLLAATAAFAADVVRPTGSRSESRRRRMASVGTAVQLGRRRNGD